MGTLPNQVPLAIATDLDDTLHQAEFHVMGRRWNHLLQPWGVVWERYGKEKSEYPEGTRFSEDLGKPGVGVSTDKVISFFIEKYGLDINVLNPENMAQAGFAESCIQQILDIQTGDLTPDKKIEDIVKSLDREGKRSSAQLIREGNVVKAVEGAPEMITRLHEAGFIIPVITQSDLSIAQTILEQLGFIQYDEVPFQYQTGRDGKIVEISSLKHVRKASSVDLIITASMVENPKPAPDPFRKAEWIINLHAATTEERQSIRSNLTGSEIYSRREKEKRPFTDDEKRELRTRAEKLTPNGIKIVGYLGDSKSDVRAAGRFRIPVVIIRTPYNSREELEEVAEKEKATMIFVESPNQVTPDMFRIPPSHIETTNRPHPEMG